MPATVGVLAGGRPFVGVDAGAFHRRDRAAAGVVVGGVDAGEPVVAERGDRLLHLASGRLSAAPAGRVVLLGDFDAGCFEARCARRP